MKYKFLEHTADIKIRVYGKSLNEIFNNSSIAFSEYVSRGNKIKKVVKKKILVKGQDNEALLYAFIDELIYLVDAKNFIVSDAKVKINKGILKGELAGDNVKNYKGLDHVKAATYAEMYVKENKENWEAQFVMDI